MIRLRVWVKNHNENHNDNCKRPLTPGRPNSHHHCLHTSQPSRQVRPPKTATSMCRMSIETLAATATMVRDVFFSHFICILLIILNRLCVPQQDDDNTRRKKGWSKLPLPPIPTKKIWMPNNNHVRERQTQTTTSTIKTRTTGSRRKSSRAPGFFFLY